MEVNFSVCTWGRVPSALWLRIPASSQRERVNTTDWCDLQTFQTLITNIDRTMQSSPPTRAWDRPPSSPTDSHYSIDLAALDLDSHSGASTPLPTQHVDRVLSEDIDGPSDFTQNMEAWMRGGTLKKGSLKSGFAESEECKGRGWAWRGCA